MPSIEDYKNEATLLIKGSIDTHIHSGPDVVPRKMNDFELARDCAKAGMRGLVVKCHVAATEGRASIVQQQIDNIKVWGGIALNHHTGGLNPEAVRISAKMGAKIIWMPTVSSENHIHYFGLSGHMDALGGGMAGKGITIYNQSGKIKEEVFNILEIIKEADIILATGHLSPKESIDLITVALRNGLKKILFTHPEGHLTKLPVEEQKRLAKKGVFFERCWVVTTNIAGESARLPAENIARDIKTVGTSSTIMATDHGQVSNPSPAQAMTNYIANMLYCGIKAHEIELMIKTNPIKLIET